MFCILVSRHTVVINIYDLDLDCGKIKHIFTARGKVKLNIDTHLHLLR